MMVDAVFGHDACHSDRGHPDSPSTCTHSPRTTSPVGVVQASLQESETPAGKSSDDATPGARNSSLTARMSPEPHRGQDLGDAGCRSGDPESETVDGAPDKARPSPQLPPPRRSRRRSPHAHTTAQEEDSGADTESSGSEDNPDVPEYARDEDYCPSPPEVQESGSQDDDVDDGEHQDHKRRKVSKSPSCPTHNAATSARDSRRRRRSTRASAHSLMERDTSALSHTIEGRGEAWVGGDSPAFCSTFPRTRRLESTSALLHETQVPQNLMSPCSSGSEGFEVVGRYLTCQGVLQ